MKKLTHTVSDREKEGRGLHRKVTGAGKRRLQAGNRRFACRKLRLQVGSKEREKGGTMMVLHALHIGPREEENWRFIDRERKRSSMEDMGFAPVVVVQRFERNQGRE